MSTNIAIKGTRSGLLLTLQPAVPFADLLSALATRLSESPTFFRGASLTVDTTYRSLRTNERMQLEELLAHYHMSMSSVETVEQSPAGRRSAQTISLATPDLNAVMEGKLLNDQESMPPTPVPPSPQPSFQTAAAQPAYTRQLSPQFPPEARTPEVKPLKESDDTLFIRRTIRSGQAIHHHSNIVVLGDVNPGAEIVAGGDIIVWGVLRGMVHAGYADNENAVVCALQLAPVQLRIAHLLSRPPEGFIAQPSPEVASIHQGQIMVETWLGGRSPRK